MNISGVQAKLTGDDILSIINEFVKLENLNINEVIINNQIMIKGTLKMKFKVNFQVVIDLLGVKDGIINGKFSGFKVMKMGLFRPIRSLVLKFALKAVNVNGIKADKDRVQIDVSKILLEVPFVDFKFADVYTQKNLLHVEVEEINISLSGGLVKEKQPIIESKEQEVLLLPINKVKDGYTKGRVIAKEKIPERVKNISEYILLLPDIMALIYRLLKDNRVGIKTKIAVSASILYIVIPIDIIPDRIPFIGKVDDLAVAFFALNIIARDVPTNVILENWAGKNDLINVLKNGLEYITEFTGAKNVEKIYNLIK